MVTGLQYNLCTHADAMQESNAQENDVSYQLLLEQYPKIKPILDKLEINQNNITSLSISKNPEEIHIMTHPARFLTYSYIIKPDLTNSENFSYEEHNLTCLIGPEWNKFVAEKNVRHYLETYKNLEQTLQKLGILKEDIENIYHSTPETICVTKKSGEQIEFVRDNEETYRVVNIKKKE